VVVLDKAFHINNRKKLMDSIEDNSLVVLFAGSAPKKSADENYDFTPNRNFYYITGIEREKVVFLLSKLKGKTEEFLFIEEPDGFREKWTGKMMTIEEAKEISGIENIKYLDTFLGSLNRMLQGGDIKIYLDLEIDSWDMLPTRVQAFANDVRNRYPYVVIKNIYDVICSMRTIKTSDEAENIRKAIDITREGIDDMMKNARPGMMEYELEAYFDFALKRNGIRHTAFHTIAASG
jgi:Xaa-Pro aminopeptidase